MMNGDPAIRLHDITVRLGRRTVLDGLSCEIGRGVTAVVGPNGAGKSTLLRTIVGALAPHGGRVEALGLVPHANPTEHRRYCALVGWMPQSAPLPSSFTVRRLLEHAAWLKALEAPTAGAAVERAMATARVTAFADRRLGQMSGGERQRAVLAACLVGDPAVLVLDEPTVGLDPGQRETFHEAVRIIGLESAVVVSTHILEDVFGVADRVVGMTQGRIALDRPMSDEPALREDVMALFRGNAA